MSGKTEPENTEKWSKSALKNKKRREAAKVNENSKKFFRPKYSWNLFFKLQKLEMYMMSQKKKFREIDDTNFISKAILTIFFLLTKDFHSKMLYFVEK